MMGTTSMVAMQAWSREIPKIIQYASFLSKRSICTCVWEVWSLLKRWSFCEVPLYTRRGARIYLQYWKNRSRLASSTCCDQPTATPTVSASCVPSVTSTNTSARRRRRRWSSATPTSTTTTTARSCVMTSRRKHCKCCDKRSKYVNLKR